MKNIYLILSVLILVFSCTKEVQKDYVTISGKISNSSAKNIDITSRGINKRIKVNEDGTFKDTVKVMFNGYQTFEDGNNKGFIYVKNGDEIEINYDYNDFFNTVSFNGKGFGTSKYIIERKKLDEKEGFTDVKKLFKLDSKEFISKIKKLENKTSELLQIKGIDSTVKANEISRNKKFFAFLRKNYARKHDLYVKFKKGNKSPKFVNYEKYGGGKVSLDDFLGKFVYIDVWATWCGPCKREIPHLKSLYNDYKNKNIEFISISVDNGRGYRNDPIKAKKAWNKMIKDKQTSWLQLYADKAWNSDFIKKFSIRSIPRFILIDDKGNIVDANAPRPSNPKLRTVLDDLLK